MGASNALLVYRVYGSAVGDRALRLLTYMALVSRDRDSEPWCQIGHEALSEFALGHPLPDEQKAREQALRIVRRAMTQLADAGAVRTIKRATFGRRGVSPARYRLYLTGPCPESRPKSVHRSKNDPSPPVRNRPVAVASIGHSMTVHRSLNGRPQVTERPTKEEEETRGAINTGVLQSTRTVEGSNCSAPEPVENLMSAIEAAAWAAVGRTPT